MMEKEKNLEMELMIAAKKTLLTPFKTPTMSSDTFVGVEKDMDCFCDAGYVRNSLPLIRFRFFLTCFVAAAFATAFAAAFPAA